MPPVLHEQKRGERGSSLPRLCAVSLIDGRNVVRIVGFVRFTKVALTAELRRRRCIGIGHVVDIGVVGAIDEEERWIPAGARADRQCAARAGRRGNTARDSLDR